jgi:4-methyl-5(b-hydroxyethyl)-thiazole monophosphate biosynthesis
MAARVLVPLAAGFEDMEAVTLVDLLRRAEIEVVTAGLEAGAVRGSRGTWVIPDAVLDEVLHQEFDMVVLPGGLPGSDHLNADPRIHELLRRTSEAGRYTAAICAAPKVLAGAGLLAGKKATAYPGVLEGLALADCELCAAPVVQDGKVVTSRGPGTAMDFGLELIEILAGAQVRQEVEGRLHRPG